MAATSIVVGGVVALLLLGLGAYTSYTLSRRLLGESAVSVRWCGAGVIWVWLLLALFHGLAPAKLFTVPWTSGVWICLALLIGLVLDRDLQTLRSFRSDVGIFGAHIRQLLSSKEAWLYRAAGAMLLFAATRAMLAPPLSWDSLTYHLFMAGKWVQTGGTFHLQAPDAWSYYQYYLANGEILCAWFMLPFGGDFAVGLANFPLWALALLAFYALARHLGVDRRYASLGAALLGFTPAVFSYLVTAYVDIGLVAELLCATLFLVGVRQGHRGGQVLIAFLALGCALGTKLTAVPVVVLGITLWLLSCKVRHAAMWKHATSLVIGLILAAAVSAPWYLRAWVDHNSPTYPFPIHALGRTIFAGSTAMTDMLTSKLALVAARPEFAVVHSVAPLLPNVLTPGLLAFVSLIALPFGMRRCWRPGLRLATIVMLMCVAVSLAGYYCKQMDAFRLYWPAVSSRFLVFPLAILLLWTAAALEAPGGFSSRLYFLVIIIFAINLVFIFPMGFAGTQLLLVIGVTCGLACVGWLLLALVRRTKHARPNLPIAAGVLCLLAGLSVLPGLDHLRSKWRYAFLADAYELHQFRRQGLRAWQFCDQPSRPRRIAFTAGWDGTGHNWFWYPLMGRYLQNVVTYVPVTRDGTVIDYARAEQLAEQADFRSWLGNLLQQRVDTIVCLPPEPVESQWLRRHGDLFVRLAGDDQAGVYELVTENARRFLEEGSH